MTTVEASQNKAQQKGIVIILLIVVFGLLTWGMYEMLTGPARYNNRDFMSLYAGG